MSQRWYDSVDLIGFLIVVRLASSSMTLVRGSSVDGHSSAKKQPRHRGSSSSRPPGTKVSCRSVICRGTLPSLCPWMNLVRRRSSVASVTEMLLILHTGERSEEHTSELQ